jgi:peptidylprolyl isomerase
LSAAVEAALIHFPTTRSDFVARTLQEASLLKRRFLALAGLAAVTLAAGPVAAQQAASDPQNTIYLDTKDGRVVIRLRPDLAPKHAERIRTLAAQGFYNGLKFHRVIEGFMAQTGDPTGTGSGGSPLPNLPAEFSARPFERGVVGMARTSDPNSANSQFFITFASSPWLNGQYTVVGEVVSGMEVVDKIKKGDKNAGGMVQNPDVIVKMQPAAAAK